jgi:hypothetical protein
LGDTSFKAAFAEFGAKSQNLRNVYSAIADDGSIVVCCWANLIKPNSGKVRYEIEDLQEWTSNAIGREALKAHISLAFSEGRKIRMIRVEPQAGPTTQIAGRDGSQIVKKVFAQKNLVGTVVHYDGVKLIVDFEKA